MWNRAIESINISFLPMCMTFYSSVKTIQLSEKGSTSDYITSILIALVAVGTVSIYIRTLYVKRRDLKNKFVIEKIGSLYSRIQIRRRISLYAYLYHPISLLRRMIFVCVPLWLPDSGRQI